MAELTQSVIDSIFNEVLSHAARSGYFDRVNGHESKSAPNLVGGLAAEVWVQRIRAARSSGLAETSGLLVLTVRIRGDMLAKPEDGIDPRLLTAASGLMRLYVGDFTLNDLIRAVDVRGMEGTPLTCEAGYLPQDQKVFRVYEITLPLIVNDIWSEAP